MALDNGRVHIDRGDLLLRRTPAQLRDQVAVHLAQTGQRRAFAGNVGHLAQRQLRFRLLDPGLVVKPVEKAARRLRRRQFVTYGNS